MIRAVVLGAAAGGGFPQWNSNGASCRRARGGLDRCALPRTQASLAVSSDGLSWFLLNASPDLRQQIAATPRLHPREGLRSTPIAGVLLTGGEVDAVAGLLSLRERQALRLVATEAVLRLLDANPIFEALARDFVPRERVALDRRFPLRKADGAPTGLHAVLFPVPGTMPLYMESRIVAPRRAEIDDADGITTGVIIDDGVRRLLYIPGCAAMTGAVRENLHGADVIFFDGTLWQDDEMIRASLGPKTGRRMGHMSISGEQGVIAALAGLDLGRKVLIHLNNSNPVLLDDTPERRVVEAAGWEVAYDGMEMTLS
jgi:pyrroloquinoline quinone biosynthesis protein B